MPHNKQSAARIRKIVELYNSLAGLSPADGDEISLSDLLAEIRHFCRQNDIDFGSVLFRANNYYADELESVA
jgi:hypothetical protein